MHITRSLCSKLKLREMCNTKCKYVSQKIDTYQKGFKYVKKTFFNAHLPKFGPPVKSRQMCMRKLYFRLFTITLKFYPIKK